MPPELEAAINNAASMVAQLVQNLSTLTVTTNAIDVNGNAPRLLAKSEFKLDGDTSNSIPVSTQDGNITVNREILALHNASVEAAINYRSEALQMLLRLVRGQ
jgi:hypothetical protein